jgi:hypothetical protein
MSRTGHFQMSGCSGSRPLRSRPPPRTEPHCGETNAHESQSPRWRAVRTFLTAIKVSFDPAQPITIDDTADVIQMVDNPPTDDLRSRRLARRAALGRGRRVLFRHPALATTRLQRRPKQGRPGRHGDDPLRPHRPRAAAAAAAHRWPASRTVRRPALPVRGVRVLSSRAVAPGCVDVDRRAGG